MVKAMNKYSWIRIVSWEIERWKKWNSESQEEDWTQRSVKQSKRDRGLSCSAATSSTRELEDSSHPIEDLSGLSTTLGSFHCRPKGHRAGRKKKSLCTPVAWEIQGPPCQAKPTLGELTLSPCVVNSLPKGTTKQSHHWKLDWRCSPGAQGELLIKISCVFLFAYCISLLSFHFIVRVLAIWSIHCFNNTKHTLAHESVIP